MGIESLVVLLLIGAVAGWLAGQIMKGYGFGLIGNIVVGIVGGIRRRAGFSGDRRLTRQWHHRVDNPCHNWCRHPAVFDWTDQESLTLPGQAAPNGSHIFACGGASDRRARTGFQVGPPVPFPFRSGETHWIRMIFG